MTNEFLKVQLLHFIGVVDKFSHLCQIYSQITVPKIYQDGFSFFDRVIQEKTGTFSDINKCTCRTDATCSNS